MLAFLPINEFGWAVFFAICIVGIGILVALGVMAQGFLEPVYARVKEGKPAVKRRPVAMPGHMWCCPPGLGCNEKKGGAPCRRLLAYKLADAVETQTLDDLWSELHRHPTPVHLHGWEDFRDTLIREKLGNVENDSLTKRLLGQNETIELVSGEVVDPPKPTKRMPASPE